MFLQKTLKRKDKRALFFLILRLHVLVFLLIGVLWSRNQLKKKSLEKAQPKILERKARFIPLDTEKPSSD